MVMLIELYWNALTVWVQGVLVTGFACLFLQVHFEVADATKREFPEGSFDVVYSRDTILHIDDKLALFKRFHVSVCTHTHTHNYTTAQLHNRTTAHTLTSIPDCIIFCCWFLPSKTLCIFIFSRGWSPVARSWSLTTAVERSPGLLSSRSMSNREVTFSTPHHSTAR